MEIQPNQFYQDNKTGKKVKLVGGVPKGEQFVMVMGNDRLPYYAALEDLKPLGVDGRADHQVHLVNPIEKDPEKELEPLVVPTQPQETRLNLNVAGERELMSRIPGIGFRTARALVKERSALPGERFQNFDQVKSLSNRVNWDKVIEEDLVFIG